MLNTRTALTSAFFKAKPPRVVENKNTEAASEKKTFLWTLTKPENAIVEGFSAIFSEVHCQSICLIVLRFYVDIASTAPSAKILSQRAKKPCDVTGSNKLRRNLLCQDMATALTTNALLILRLFAIFLLNHPAACQISIHSPSIPLMSAVIFIPQFVNFAQQVSSSKEYDERFPPNFLSFANPPQMPHVVQTFKT